MFAALTRMNPYLKKKISLFVALAPVTKLPHHSVSLIQYAVDHYDLVDDAVWTFGVHSIG